MSNILLLSDPESVRFKSVLIALRNMQHSTFFLPVECPTPDFLICDPERLPSGGCPVFVLFRRDFKFSLDWARQLEGRRYVIFVSPVRLDVLSSFLHQNPNDLAAYWNISVTLDADYDEVLDVLPVTSVVGDGTELGEQIMMRVSAAIQRNNKIQESFTNKHVSP